MNGIEIFNKLCECRNPDAVSGKSPIQLKQEGIKITDIEDNGVDVISHTKFEGEDGGIVEEIITSYDHSRSFELRPDPNHFYIMLYDKMGNKIRDAHFMQMDSM